MEALSRQTPGSQKARRGRLAAAAAAAVAAADKSSSLVQIAVGTTVPVAGSILAQQ